MTELIGTRLCQTILLFCVFSLGLPALASETPPNIARTANSQPSSQPTNSVGPITHELVGNINDECLTIQFESQPSEVISCRKLLPMKYSRRNCGDSKLLEKGTVDAIASCEDPKKIGVLFKTSQKAIHMRLKVQRESRGRGGVRTRYVVDRTEEENSDLVKALPAPSIEPLDGSIPEEAPVHVRFSGYAWFEFEQTQNFGFDAPPAGSTTAAIRNFDSNVEGSKQRNSNFFSNFNLDLSKDRTTLSSIFEVGEIVSGNEASGGKIGGRSRAVEVRNLFLNHDLSDWLGLRVGLISTASDPRSFIFNDHLASAQVSYKTDLSSGLLWYGTASQTQPGEIVDSAGNALARDEYTGLVGSLAYLSRLKHSVYLVYRSTSADQFAVDDGSGTDTYRLDASTSEYWWAGATVDYEGFDPLAAQLTVIGNWGRSRVLGQPDDDLQAYLLDTKWTYSMPISQINFTLEGLFTPGATDTKDPSGNLILGKRRHFVSPVAASYLLTIATSDGVDDSPGTPKQSIIASLSQPEGLKVGVFTVSFNADKRLTFWVRYGHLWSAAKAASTNSDVMGSEVDAGGVYQITPSTTCQVNYGSFQPGDFFQQHDRAELIAAKLAFAF